MRHFGKRGMDDKLAFVMWEIMVIFMVVIALTISVKGIANNTTYWKKYHSADLALMTDLILVNQGDFKINYDMKELKSTTVSKVLGIDGLVFQTKLIDGAYLLYDTSSNVDRFPQSYIFAKNTAKIKIIQSDTTNNYIVLNKKGDLFSMTDGFATSELSCPSLDTAIKDISTKKVSVTSLSDTLKEYNDINNNLLDTSGTELELLIILSESTSNKNRIYYDTTIGNLEKGKKMSCLITRQLLKQDVTLNVQNLANDNTIDTESLNIEKDKYNYWIIIELNKNDITKEKLSSSIIAAIKEYYGSQ